MRALQFYIRDHLRALVPQEFDFNREVRRSFEDLAGFSGDGAFISSTLF